LPNIWRTRRGSDQKGRGKRAVSQGSFSRKEKKKTLQEEGLGPRYTSGKKRRRKKGTGRMIKKNKEGKARQAPRCAVKKKENRLLAGEKDLRSPLETNQAGKPPKVWIRMTKEFAHEYPLQKVRGRSPKGVRMTQQHNGWEEKRRKKSQSDWGSDGGAGKRTVMGGGQLP